MDTNGSYSKIVAQTVMKNLEKRQMEAYYCPSKEEATQKVLSLMKEGSSVAWGGSMSLKESGLMAALTQGKYQIISRDMAKSESEREAVAAQTVNCDYFLMSANAISMDGELVNIDGRGNRVSYLCYGPKNVIVLAGMNKVAPDFASALARARNVAAPKNAIRLGAMTPCAANGRCFDCQSPDCICADIVVVRRSFIKNRIKVVLVGEELGF